MGIMHMSSDDEKKKIIVADPEFASKSFVKKLLDQLKQLSEKLEDVSKEINTLKSEFEKLKGNKKVLSRKNRGFDALDLLDLPKHLQETAKALTKISQGTASDIAKETKKKRAVESDYLNQLVNLGYINKQRKGRKVYFYIQDELNL